MEFPKGGLIGRVMTMARRVKEMNIPGHAANSGYFIVLAVFPALVLVLSVLRYTDLDTGDLIALMDGFVPAALMDAAEDLIVATYAHASTAVVSVSALGALWSASRGIYGILKGLNAIYGVQENRGYLYTRFISVVYTFLLLVVLILTLVMNVFSEDLLEMALPRFVTRAVNLRGIVLLLLQTALFTAMFMVLPNRKNRFADSLPGAVLASIGWLVFTQLFSWYVTHFAGYSNIYGSVYAVALSMLWLYCCMSILFGGGALNQLLMEQKEKM